MILKFFHDLLDSKHDCCQNYHSNMIGEPVLLIQEALREKSIREAQHSERVAVICRAIAKAMGLPQEKVDEMGILGLIHDIGKVVIPNEILNKPSGLTIAEGRIMSRHPETGYSILCQAGVTKKLARYVLYHHERYDGKGYPAGFKGEEIPLQSRILAIADAFDAMTSERVYRKALPLKKALKELRANAGTQFDPYIISVFFDKVIASIPCSQSLCAVLQGDDDYDYKKQKETEFISQGNK